jgi:hypothetical protein
METSGLIIDASKTFLVTKEPQGYSPLKAKGDSSAGIELY